MVIHTVVVLGIVLVVDLQLTRLDLDYSCDHLIASVRTNDVPYWSAS